jgi:hypothetical protein
MMIFGKRASIRRASEIKRVLLGISKVENPLFLILQKLIQPLFAISNSNIYIYIYRERERETEKI